MFLRCNNRKKDGKDHRYWSIVENRRLRVGHVTQRQVLYLGEINDVERAAWHRTIAVVNEDTPSRQQVSLFPEDREIPVEVLNGLQVKLSELRLCRPRAFGDCWLACRLWDGLQLGSFWRDRLPQGRAQGFVKLTVPQAKAPVNRETFRFELLKPKLKAAELRDGHYLLRSFQTGQPAGSLWEMYMQLTEIEAAFKCLKSKLKMRPIHHQLEVRIEAHIFVAFLAYCLSVTLRKKLQAHAPGLTPRAVLEKLSTILMLDVRLPLVDGRELVMARYTQPEPEHQVVLEKLRWSLPPQPPPRIRAAAVGESGSVQAKKTNEL